MIEFNIMNSIIKMAEMTFAVEHETHKALEHAAKIVETEAKREIGHYQTAAGPFAGWAELADATKADRLAQGYAENDPGLRSGEMQDSIGHSVNGHTAIIGSEDDKLVWFELGTSRQPPRSVLGTAAVHKEEQVVEILGAGAVTALIGGDVIGRYLSIRE